jgi:hypothetical protein
MTRDEARRKLRELLEPIRIMAEMEYTVPDIQDAVRLLIVHDEDSETRRVQIEALVAEAGYDLLEPLGVVFEEEG